jgi:hypothetical protein
VKTTSKYNVKISSKKLDLNKTEKLHKDNHNDSQILNVVKTQFPSSDAAIYRKFPSAEVSTAILNVNTDYTAGIFCSYS